MRSNRKRPCCTALAQPSGTNQPCFPFPNAWDRVSHGGCFRAGHHPGGSCQGWALLTSQSRNSPRLLTNNCSSTTATQSSNMAPRPVCPFPALKNKKGNKRSAATLGESGPDPYFWNCTLKHIEPSFFVRSARSASRRGVGRPPLFTSFGVFVHVVQLRCIQ